MYFRGHVYEWRQKYVTWICSIAESHWQSEVSSNPIMNRIPYLWGVLESPSWYYFRKSSGWVILANSSNDVTLLERISDGFAVNSEFLFYIKALKPAAFWNVWAISCKKNRPWFIVLNLLCGEILVTKLWALQTCKQRTEITAAL
jgi:hypothetical protein